MVSIKKLVLTVLFLSSSGCHGNDRYYDEDYDSMTVADLWHYFDCDRIFRRRRPIHSDENWVAMREAYQSVVGSERSSLSSDDGFSVPVQARHAGDKGRGVFVAAPVTKGQLVWSTKKTARFDKGTDYRAFLAKIRPDFACDVLQWAYVQSLSDARSQTDKSFISVDLDEGSFINSVDDWDDEPNLGCDPEACKDHEGGCKQNYFALRDIDVGEELILDYGDFAISEGWEWFGL